MGKGDQRTKRGKIYRGTSGKTRQKKAVVKAPASTAKKSS
jgi:ribosomal small subunit protein bTHX